MCQSVNECLYSSVLCSETLWRSRRRGGGLMRRRGRRGGEGGGGGGGGGGEEEQNTYTELSKEESLIIPYM